MVAVGRDLGVGHPYDQSLPCRRMDVRSLQMLICIAIRFGDRLFDTMPGAELQRQSRKRLLETLGRHGVELTQTLG